MATKQKRIKFFHNVFVFCLHLNRANRNSVNRYQAMANYQQNNNTNDKFRQSIMCFFFYLTFGNGMPRSVIGSKKPITLREEAKISYYY